MEVLERPLQCRREFSKPLQIATVAFEGVIGKAPFDA